MSAANGFAQAQQQAPALCVAETEIARKFYEHYYQTFDFARDQLASLYRDVSTISFEGENLVGGAAFLTKIAAMGIPSGVRHKVIAFSAQPSAAGGNAILVFVTGDFVDRQFSELFHLVPDGGSYYIHNQMFRVDKNNAFNVPSAEAGNVAKMFIEHYFNTYDNNRAGLGDLLEESSYFSYENDIRRGKQSIMEKLLGMPAMRHDPESITADVHCLNGTQVMVIVITGRLCIDDSEHPLNFAESFLLMQQNGRFYLGNVLFRLKYG